MVKQFWLVSFCRYLLHVQIIQLRSSGNDFFKTFDVKFLRLHFELQLGSNGNKFKLETFKFEIICQKLNSTKLKNKFIVMLQARHSYSTVTKLLRYG